jgi:DNA repair exonuclease SbcCD nuclease subunit
MQIALIHLSDIHIKSAVDPVLSRADSIRGALHKAAPNAKACLIVISGDVAFSGLAGQYDLAVDFLNDLRTELLRLPTITKIEFVVVPGNHDCDFMNESDIRQFLLRDTLTLFESDIQPASDRVQALVAIQKHFFAFEAKLAQSKELSFAERLSWARIFKFENYSIHCNCFNTAWLSRKHEFSPNFSFRLMQ